MFCKTSELNYTWVVKSYSLFGVTGSFFEGQIPDTICFVPDSLVKEGLLDEGLYVVQGWAALNIKAQPFGIGSHMFPNLMKPIEDEALCAKRCETLIRLRPPRWAVPGVKEM